MTWFVSSSHVYYCRGLLSSSEGYFVLPAALSLLAKVITQVSHVCIIWWCVGRNTREYQLYFIDHLIQNQFISYINLKKKSWFHFIQAAALFSLNPLHIPSEKKCGVREAQGNTFSWVVLILQAAKTVHLRGTFFLTCFIVRNTAFLRDKLSFYLSISKGKTARVHRADARRLNAGKLLL